MEFRYWDTEVLYLKHNFRNHTSANLTGFAAASMDENIMEPELDEKQKLSKEMLRKYFQNPEIGPLLMRAVAQRAIPGLS